MLVLPKNDVPFDVIIYHGNCYDGFTAAWVARIALDNSNVEFFGLAHGDPIPNILGKNVLILDFSFPRNILETLIREAKNILLLDHHKSARENLGDLDCCFFDMARSGAGIAWDFFFPTIPRPDIINYVEDFDLGRYSLPGSREYHASLTAREMSFENWNSLANNEKTKELIEEGKKLLKFKQTLAKRFAERAGIGTIDGVTPVWITNTPIEFVVEVSEILFQIKESEGRTLPVLSWMADARRGDFYCSLRSCNDRIFPNTIDCSEIASRFGGGGHRLAAGFRLSNPPGFVLNSSSFLQWTNWISEQIADFKISLEQFTASAIWQSVPVFFQGIPSAFIKEDGVLCLCWKRDPWTLSIEIDKEGHLFWTALCRETREELTSEVDIRQKFM